MHRRTLLSAATAVAGAVAGAGCVERGTPFGDGDGGGSGSDSAGETTLTGIRLTRRAPGAPGTAHVEYRSDAVRVEGTVVGDTGCHVPALDAATVSDDGEFHVVVAAVDDSGPNELCTQALTELGYAVEATFEGGVPAGVTVVHADATGRETVAIGSPER